MNENLNEEEKEKLRLENEIRKIKLELEKGAKFIEDPDMPALPPEVENEFLNYIEQFEKMNENSQKISIYEKIGSPEFIKASELKKASLKKELKNVTELLADNGIHVDFIYDVDEMEKYRFITEDLFRQEVYEIKDMKGLMMHFTYEEFYPNEVYDVINALEDFIEKFFNKNDEEDLYMLDVQEPETTNQWMAEFRGAYNKFDLHSLNIHSVQVHDDIETEAEVAFDIWFDAYTDGRTEKHIYNGVANAMLVYRIGGWGIKSLVFPKAE